MTEDHIGEPETVAIPTWFLKLVAWAIGLSVFGMVSWMTWVSFNILEIRTQTDKSGKNEIRIQELNKELQSLQLEIERLKR